MCVPTIRSRALRARLCLSQPRPFTITIFERHQPDFCIHLGASRGHDIIGTSNPDFDGSGTKSHMKMICVLGTPSMSHVGFQCNQFEALPAFKNNTCKQTLPARCPGLVAPTCVLAPETLDRRTPRLVPVLLAPQALGTCSTTKGTLELRNLLYSWRKCSMTSRRRDHAPPHVQRHRLQQASVKCIPRQELKHRRSCSDTAHSQRRTDVHDG